MSVLENKLNGQSKTIVCIQFQNHTEKILDKVDGCLMSLYFLTRLLKVVC